MLCLVSLILYKMNAITNYIYNPINILNETNKHICLTTFKVIKASRPLFPLILPSAVVSSISIAEKGWDLKTKIDKLSKEYFSSNKTHTQKTGSKHLTRRKIPSPHRRRKRRSAPLNKKIIFMASRERYCFGGNCTSYPNI